MNVFIELTEAEDEQRKVAIALRAVQYIAPYQSNADLSVVYFTDEDYLIVREDYATIMGILNHSAVMQK